MKNSLPKVINDYLVIWIILAVVIGILFPYLEQYLALTSFILFIMIFSVSLTLSFESYRMVRIKLILLNFVAHLTMPFFALLFSVLLNLPIEMIIGFVVLGTVVPELVSPTLTKLAGGNTALSTIILITLCFGSLIIIPGILFIFGGSVVVINVWFIFMELLILVIAPILLALSIKHLNPNRLSVYDNYFLAVSSLMQILIIGISTASHSANILSNVFILFPIIICSILLNVTGYAIGWILVHHVPFEDRVATIFSIGTRDFAIATVLILVVGLPHLATLPAIIFAIVYMITGGMLIRIFKKKTGEFL